MAVSSQRQLKYVRPTLMLQCRQRFFLFLSEAGAVIVTGSMAGRERVAGEGDSAEREREERGGERDDEEVASGSKAAGVVEG